MKSVDKQAIAAAFSRAAPSYDAVAQLQREVGNSLLNMEEISTAKTILDAGCGTGYFSNQLRQQGNKVIALDLAPGMLAYARNQQVADEYLLADIEHIPLPEHSVDVCFSNLALQWCNNFSDALAQLYRVTRPGGAILFSTIIQGSLHELAQTWQHIDGNSHINTFLSLTQIDKICGRYRYFLTSHWRTLYFPDVLTLMYSLKGIGATHLHQRSHSGLLTRRRLLTLQAAYPCHNGQYPLSYHLACGVIYRD